MSAQSRVTSRCDVAHSGWEKLHHSLPVLLRDMLPLFSIMTLWVFLRQWLTREAGWRYGIMSTVPYEQQKLYRQNNLIITREAGLTPREPSVSSDVDV